MTAYFIASPKARFPKGAPPRSAKPLPDHAEQKALLNLVESQERKGERITNDTIRELADFVTGSGKRTETTASLFGDQQIEKSLALEKAEVSAYIKQQLAKDRKLFGYVSNDARATELARAGNKLDTDKNRSIAESAAQAEAVYDKLKTFAGPINQALQSAAEKLAEGKDPNAAKQEAYTAIRQAVSETLAGEQGPGAAPGQRGAGPGSRDETETQLDPNQNILFRHRLGPADSADLIVRHAHAMEHTYREPRDIKPATIELNEAGRRTMSGILGTDLLGATIPQSRVPSVLNELRGWAGLLRQDGNDAGARNLDQIARSIQRAAEANARAGVPLFAPDHPEARTAAAEELFHALQFKYGIPWREMEDSPIFDKLQTAIEKQIGPAAPGTIVAEAMADIWLGEYAEHGITEADAAQFAAGYFSHLPAEATPEAEKLAALTENEYKLEIGGGENGQVRQAIKAAKGTGSLRQGLAGEDPLGRRNRSNSDKPGEKPLYRPGERIEDWAASAKSLTISPAGEQTDLFGSPVKMYELAKTDASGETRTRLISQLQRDMAMQNKKFRSAVEAGKQQGMFSEQDQGTGELHGQNAKPSITLPPQASDDQPTLFRPESGRAILNGWNDLKNSVATEHAKIQDAKSIDDAIFQLQKSHEARQLEAIKIMRAAKGTPEDWEAIYHHQENPRELLTPEQRDLKSQFVDPIDTRNQELYQELRPEGISDPNHVHRVVQDSGSWLDRMLHRKGSGGAGRSNVLSKSADSLKGRTMMAIETEDGRRVVALKGGEAIDVETGKSWGNVKTDEDTGDRYVGDNPLVQATTKEIERATALKYYHNSLASEIAENLELERAAAATKYLEHLKSSPDFAEYAIKDTGRMNTPEGYARTDLPQLRDYFFEKHVAEVLDDLHKSLKAGDWSALEKVGDFLTTSIFMNPLLHTPNIAVHAAVNKGKLGFGGFVAPAIAAERKAGMRAIDAVTHQNADYLQALKAGAPLQSHRQDLRDFQKLLFEKMGKEMEEDHAIAARIGRAFGYADPVKFLKGWYKLSGKITWTTNDVAYMQSVYSMMDKGVSLQDAIRETSKHIPDYRIPSRIMDSRLLSQFMRNRLFSRFSAYHYGAAKSYGEAMKSALGVGSAPDVDSYETTAGGGGRDGKNWKDIRHGWDILASIGFVTFVVYPLLDAALKKVTGDHRAFIRRAGAATIPYNVGQVIAGKRTPSQALESTVTPSVIAEHGIGLLYGHDPRTGRAVYDPAAPAKDEVTQALRYGLGAVYPVDQALRVLETPNSRHSTLWQYAGVSFPRNTNPRHQKAMGKPLSYYRNRFRSALP